MWLMMSHEEIRIKSKSLYHSPKPQSYMSICPGLRKLSCCIFTLFVTVSLGSVKH